VPGSLQRIWILFAGIVLAFGVVVFRLANLQIVRSAYYDAVAHSQRQRASELMPHRGTVYVYEGGDKDPFPIAVNREAWIAYAVPRDMDDASTTANELAPELVAFRERQQQRVNDIIEKTGQAAGAAAHEPTPTPAPLDQRVQETREALFQKLNQKADPYEPFLRPYEVLDDEFKAFLEKKQMKGIVLETKEVRFYPEGTLGAHVLGYVGGKDQKQSGYYGIEGYFEDKLAGSLGFLSSEEDSSGQFIGVGSRTFQAAHDGDDIVLSIDRVVQSIIEQELKDGVTRYGAERGSVIVMNPQTGAVLGMATYPTYDPNYYFAIKDPQVQVNPAVSDLFEPGSIIKPMVMAAGIEKGTVTPDTTVVDSGPVHVADRVINTFDGRHLGKITMTRVLEQSNNIGMVWLGQQLGAETLYDFFRDFGFGEKTGIELEGETQYALPAPRDWNITTVATSSFGQGIAVTPLQALNAVNVVANGGTLFQPYIVDEIRPSSSETQKTKPADVRRVISPATAQTVSAMLVSVVENGVAQLAKVPGYYMAGKTGTAQVPDEHGRYSADRKIISFVGYPVSHPQFSILIKLDNPAGLSFASGTAAPMFRNISQKLLNYYQIPPDYDTAQRPPGFTVPSAKPNG